MGNRVRVTSHTAITTWHWQAPSADGGTILERDMVCGICQSPFETACPACTIPGDACPLLWGQCKHAFHMHCIVKWIEQQQATQQRASSDDIVAYCPMCRQTWKTV